MSLFDFFKSRWQSAGVHSTYEIIDFSQSDRQLPSTAVRSGEQYFRITLAEMFLKNDKEWFTKRAPAVYSVVRLRFGDKEEVLSNVAGPTMLTNLDATSLNKGVTINYPLMALTPFNGGDIEFEAGLVSLPGTNEARQLLKVLSGMGKALAVPQLSIALTFAQPLVDGIADLVGSDDVKLVLRLHDTFTQTNTIRPGYLVMIDAPPGTFQKSELFVKGDRLHRGANLAASVPLTGNHYALFRIDAVDERDDYHALASIDGPYQSAIAALNESLVSPDPERAQDKLVEAERLLGAAKVAVFKAKELTFKTGRRQVITALQKGFEEAKNLLGMGAAQQPVARTLADAMKGAMSASAALRAGVVTAKDLE